MEGKAIFVSGRVQVGRRQVKTEARASAESDSQGEGEHGTDYVRKHGRVKWFGALVRDVVRLYEHVLGRSVSAWQSSRSRISGLARDKGAEVRWRICQSGLASASHETSWLLAVRGVVHALDHWEGRTCFPAAEHEVEWIYYPGSMSAKCS